MARYEGVSASVIRRLPRYYRFLYDLIQRDVHRISSRELAELMNLTASQIRQDLNCFGGFGQQGYGYNVESLRDEIAEILGMSRSSLLRKIKMLSNLSPVDFIRLIRLRKAAELIHEGKYLIGDICFMVGINSPSYFSKLFLKQFGMTPKDFEKQSQADKEKIDMPS